MKRPLKSRFWFYKPGTWSPGFRIVQTGGDEFDWHTIAVGSRLTGAIVFAVRPCPLTGDCEGLFEMYDDYGVVTPEWPVDHYGHNHIDPNCSCDACLDGDE